MKFAIKDKNKFVKTLGTISLIVVIIALSVAPVLNSVFGNHIDDEIKSVPTDVVSESDVGFAEGNYVVFNSQGVKKYNVNGNFEDDYYLSAYSPMMSVRGGYTALADADSSEITLLKSGRKKVSMKVPQNVKRVNVNAKGYVTAITAEKGYKSLVIVFDKYGREVYKWYSDESYVVDALLSDNCKYLATASLSIDKDTVNTKITQFKVTSEAKLSEVLLEKNIAYQLLYKGNGLVAITDKQAVKISKMGKIKNKYEFNGKTLECFDAENEDNIALALSLDTSITDVITLNSSLKEKGKHQCKFLVNMIDEQNSKVIVSGDGKVEVINKGGTLLLSDDLEKEGKYIVLADNWRHFAVISPSQINFFTVKRGK